MAEPVVRVEHLSKRFRLFHERHQSLKQSLLNRRRSSHEDFWALSDVSFEVQRGETFGVIGHNGSGKSTLLKCLTGILEPDDGSVEVTGTISALLELGAGFHPELSGRENVFLNAAILGVPRRQIQARFDDIVEFSGLEQFIDTPVKNYSSGMFVRLGFAVAINVDPDVLIVDEVLAVGDAEFQQRCADKIAEFRERGRTIVLVTHGMSDLVKMCQRAAWLDHGTIRKIGTPHEIAEAYLTTTLDNRAAHEEGPRWGTGEITIDAVEMLGPDLAPIEFVRTGEPVAFRIHLTAHEPVVGPELVLGLFDLQGSPLTYISTDQRGAGLGTLDGPRTVTLHIDGLPLSAGTYEVGLSVTRDSRQIHYDVRSRALRLDVLPGDANDEGTLTLPAHWVV